MSRPASKTGEPSFASLRTRENPESSLVTRILITLAASLLALPLQAQVEFPPKEKPAATGPYVGGLIGRSEAKNGCIGVLSGGGRSCDKTDVAFGVFAGYQLNRYFGAEVAYQSLGRVLANASGPGSAATQEVQATVWDAAGLGTLPITDHLTAYGRLGIYRATLDASQRGVEQQSNYGVGYGGGLQWDFDRHFAVRGQWQRYKRVGREVYGNNNYDLLGASILYRFR